MDTKFLSGISALLAALLIVGTIFVAAVSANEDTPENIHPSGGDPVDRNVVLERSPHLFDDAGNRLSDREISQMIEEMPETSYLDGMSESESRELAERLRQLHKYRSVADRIASGVSSQSASVQADPGPGIDQHHFNGINGSNYPEGLRDRGSATSAGEFQSSQPEWKEAHNPPGGCGLMIGISAGDLRAVTDEKVPAPDLLERSYSSRRHFCHREGIPSGPVNRRGYHYGDPGALGLLFSRRAGFEFVFVPETVYPETIQ